MIEDDSIHGHNHGVLGPHIAELPTERPFKDDFNHVHHMHYAYVLGKYLVEDDSIHGHCYRVLGQHLAELPGKRRQHPRTPLPSPWSAHGRTTW